MNTTGAMTLTEASAVYDILMLHAGEVEEEWSRSDFVYHQSARYCAEYRFQGALGFGGKFRRDGKRLYVNCYAEDFNEERAKMIKAANKALEVFS